MSTAASSLPSNAAGKSRAAIWVATSLLSAGHEGLRGQKYRILFEQAREAKGSHVCER